MSEQATDVESRDSPQTYPSPHSKGGVVSLPDEHGLEYPEKNDWNEPYVENQLREEGDDHTDVRADDKFGFPTCGIWREDQQQTGENETDEWGGEFPVEQTGDPPYQVRGACSDEASKARQRNRP